MLLRDEMLASHSVAAYEKAFANVDLGINIFSYSKIQTKDRTKDWKKDWTKDWTKDRTKDRAKICTKDRTNDRTERPDKRLTDKRPLNKKSTE